MNRKMIFHTVGMIILLEALLISPSLIVALLYRAESTLAFLLTILICLAVGGAVMLLSRPTTRVIYAKEGFAITSLAWLSVSVFGSLPFFLSGQIPNWIDALFETVSGFTTTGASILTEVEALDRGLLFWRSFTHWIGGMGVLVFLMIFLKSVTERSIHIIRAEMPGPSVDKILPKARDTARALYIIYIALTAAAIISLLCTGMPVYDSFVHAMGTAGTGGFGIHSTSAAAMSSSQQWVLTVFMLLFGVNFNFYYLLLVRRVKTALKSSEFWAYGIIVFSCVATITANLWYSGIFTSLGETVKHAAFQVSSIITTTGFASADFNLWPNLSKSILFLLMFLGASAGSTAGGIKISRFLLFTKTCLSEFRHMIHPRSINVLRFDGKKVDSQTQHGVMIYFVLYMLCFAAIFFLLSFDGETLETALTASAACFNNVGPGFAAVGPMANYSFFSGFSKLVLCFAMLLGRLEIWPILLTFYPGSWSGTRVGRSR